MLDWTNIRHTADGATSHSCWRGIEDDACALFYQNGFVVCRDVQFSLSISKY